MKDHCKWYVDNLDDKKLLELAKEINLNIPGFSKNLSRAPGQLIRKKAEKFATRLESVNLFMATVCKLNKSLYEEIVDKDLKNIKKIEKKLIDQYGIVDYIFALLVVQEENDFEPEEIKTYIGELKEQLNGQCKNNDDNLNEGMYTSDVNEDPKQENKKLQKELNKLNTKLQRLSESFHSQLQKERSQKNKLEEKYKNELSKVNKLYQEVLAKTSQLKENLNWVTRQKEKLEKELATKETQINQLIEQNKRYEHELAEKKLALDLWQAKYPEGNPANGVLRAIIIGDKPRRKCKFYNGVPVELKSVDLSTAEEKYISGGRCEEFDLIFLISSRCNHKQRISFLRKFKGLIEVANMKQVEDNILQNAKKIAK